MKSGDIVLYKNTTSLISRLIGFFTKSEYTHVALAIGDDEVIEADRFIKTRVRKLEPSEVHEVYRVEGISEVRERRIRDLSLSYIGYEYDYLQVLGILFRLLFSTRETFFNKRNRLICSELIDVVYYASGVPRKLSRNIGDVTPAELFEVYELRKLP